MIKIIKKKDYEDLWAIINKQNEQIEELIEMVREANARTKHTTKCFLDMVEIIDIWKNILPSEARKIIDEMNQSLEKDEEV